MTMASLSVNLDDIRIIICVQGYSLDYQFIVREIGYCYNGISGSIPFNCNINKRNLDVNNQRIIYALEEEIHGIKLNKKSDYGLAQSEVRAVLRTLYAMANNSKAKYIGICRDENINGLLHKAGLGIFVVNMDNLNIFRNTLDACPSNKDLIELMKNNKNLYSVCDLHDKFKNDCIPICAKVKAEFISDFCNNFIPTQF